MTIPDLPDTTDISEWGRVYGMAMKRCNEREFSEFLTKVIKSGSGYSPQQLKREAIRQMSPEEKEEIGQRYLEERSHYNPSSQASGVGRQAETVGRLLVARKASRTTGYFPRQLEGLARKEIIVDSRRLPNPPREDRARESSS